LLRQSIIHVDQDDIEVEEEALPDQQPPVETQENRTKIKYEEFIALTKMIVEKLSEEENDAGQGISENELTQWYLEQREDSINTEEELLQLQNIIVKVLKKLTRDSILMQIGGEDTVYMLHPNCDVEQWH
jgi:DNA replication licensing factor MCM6